MMRNTATSAAPLRNGYSSSRFGEFLLISEQAGDEPEVVSEPAPGDGQVAVIEAAAAQAPTSALPEDGNAAFGR